MLSQMGDGKAATMQVVIKADVQGSAEAINARLREASQKPPLQGILEVCDDEIVSMDIVGNPHSSIVDAAYTAVMNGTFVKVLSWYDNEWGYSMRCVDLLRYMVGKGL